MTIKDIIQRNEELEALYMKALNLIETLEKKIERLEEENKKLRKQRDTLLRAVEIALQMKNKEKQDLHLSRVLEYLKASENKEKSH